MQLGRHRDRRRLRLLLSEGTAGARQAEARRALPLITETLERVRNSRAVTKARFEALREAIGQPQTGQLPAVHPLLEAKSKTFKIWGLTILGVEVALATYCATLTLGGDFLLHLLAGVIATLLFCGLAKLGVAAQTDSGRLHASAARLERQLGWTVLIAAILIGGFFVSRFFPFAEEAFALTSTLLSFNVAYLVGLCLTLSDLLDATNKEVTRFSELALVETELESLRKLARELLTGGELASSLSSQGPTGLTAMGLLLLGLLLFPTLARASETYGSGPHASTLHIWVDTSGSLAAEEFERVRAVLADPLPVMAMTTASSLALSEFAREVDALRGPLHLWSLPKQTVAPCAPSATVFKATAKAREADCTKSHQAAEARWRTTATRATDGYRKALFAIDIARQAPQTCLFPILDRVVSDTKRHLVITDGGHSACGSPPPMRRSGGDGSLVILFPDAGGSGIALRMTERHTQIGDLYPELHIVPSWKIVDVDSLAEHFLTGTKSSVPAGTTKSNGTR